MKRFAAILCIVAALMGCLVLAGCGSSDDVEKIQGQWQITGSEKGEADANIKIVVVFTETQMKSSAITMDYELDTDAGTITYANGSDSSVWDYELSGENLKISSGDTYTEYKKVSDDSTAEPSVEFNN